MVDSIRNLESLDKVAVYMYNIVLQMSCIVLCSLGVCFS